MSYSYITFESTTPRDDVKAVAKVLNLKYNSPQQGSFVFIPLKGVCATHTVGVIPDPLRADFVLPRERVFELLGI
jgi:hypothetical protein